MAEGGAAPRRAGNVLFGLAMAAGLVVIAAAGQSALPPGTALLKPIQVSDNAMAPTLTRGMLVIAYRLSGSMQRGDLIVCSPRPSEFVPGRVIGLPGDAIETRSGKLSLNGMLLNEPYVRDPIIYTVGPLVVDPGSFYVLGDNRNEASEDSHELGPIPRDRILARLQPIG